MNDSFWMNFNYSEWDFMKAAGKTEFYKIKKNNEEP